MATIVHHRITQIARKNNCDELPVQGHLLALAMRARDLNNLISAALGDDVEKVPDLRKRLNENDPAEVANG